MTISVVCNSRAEAGPLQSVIKAIPGAVVTRFDSTGMSPAVAMSQAMTFFTAMFTAQKATRVVVLGDRYETLAAALAAMFLRIPVAHIHGGETTTGAFDDPMRHAITHIADLHFVATLRAQVRVGDLVDSVRAKVHLVGAPGLDGIAPNSARRDNKRILCTYHPETRAEDYGVNGCKEMLKAVSSFLGYEVIFCGVNNDPGSSEIRETINDWLRTHGGIVRDDIAHDEYVALMQSAAAVVGNSSAGVIEAPWINVPSVNIGLRQSGRELAPSIIPTDGTMIREAIDYALTSHQPWEPIYRGGAAEKIAAILKETT